MASVIPGYEYDIFISYRHNDNRSGWVTKFIEALQEDLAASIKEPVSVYFDVNPHDGLLETHNIDKSLSGKLKCLIFIPIISQTYCDTNSFAWQHEFVEFNKMSQQDQFGRDISLSSGNVASRILPIRIHDLDPEDKSLVESELGGTLRSIEFIYKASGVNRPLKPDDERAENINHTYYRDQINKVANAVKEIITALKRHNNQNGIVEKKVVSVKPVQRKFFNVKVFLKVLIILAFIVSGYFIISKRVMSSEQPEKTIAVLPFINDSASDSTRYYINGIEEEILHNLQIIKSFKRVLSRISTEQYRGLEKNYIHDIIKNLGVNYIIQGSGQKYGKNFRLRVQLIRADNGSQLWSKIYEQEITDIFNTQSEIAQSIANELKTIISPEEKQLIEKKPTSSLMAYDFYQRGRAELPEFWLEVDDYAALNRAGKYYRKALEIDPIFADAYVGLAEIYFINYRYAPEKFLDSVLVLVNHALSNDDQLSEAYFVKGLYYAANGFKENATTEFDKALTLNQNDWMSYYGKAMLYQYEDNVMFLENLYKALQINQKGKETPTIYRVIGGGYIRTGFLDKAKACFTSAFDLDGDSSFYLSGFGGIERDQGNYQKSAEYCTRALRSRPNYYEVTDKLANDLYDNGQYREALKYYEKLKYINPQVGFSYWQTGSKKKAEQIFSQVKILSDSTIRTNRYNEQVIEAYYNLACINAFTGDISNALKYFKLFSQIKHCDLWRLTAVKHEPLINNLRNVVEFQQFQKDLENTYQAEHDRISKWLEEQGML